MRREEGEERSVNAVGRFFLKLRAGSLLCWLTKKSRREEGRRHWF
jgi:hypothetical protein